MERKGVLPENRMVKFFTTGLCLTWLILYAIVYWIDMSQTPGRPTLHPNLQMIPYRLLMNNTALLVSHIIEIWYYGRDNLNEAPDLPRILLYGFTVLSFNLAV